MLDDLASVKWTATRAPLPADAVATRTSVLDTVSCTSPQPCLAFGGYNPDGGGDWKA
jgi:hypothetical protein